jgi:predicted adenylyl cyclase CyaB
MPENIEIKARVSDPAALMNRALDLASAPPITILQKDTFFKVAEGRLKTREFPGGQAELIFYRRPDSTGPKSSDYSISRTEDGAGLLDILASALEVRGVVTKRRILLLAGRTRIHLDEVEDLGSFMELEVVLEEGEDPARGEAEAAELMKKLQIAPDDLVSGAYIDLLEKGRT